MISSVSRAGPRLALKLLLSFGLAFPLAPLAVAQGAAGAGVDEARESLAALAALLDPADYEVDELALELAFEDPEYIASWVAENLRYQVYPGLLRGPQGTLVAGAGNALDQSVLLARLLGDAGYDARVVLGELTAADALTLVMSMFAEQPSAVGPEWAAGAVDAAGLERLAVASGADREPLAAAAQEIADFELQDLPAFHDALAQTQAILAEMERPLERVATSDLVAEARQYAWVEYRLGSDAPWASAHPAWPAAAPAPEAERGEELDDEIPQELLHRLRIEVTVERKRGSDFETAPLMTPWQRPVANLLGYPIVVGNSALDAGGAADLAAMGVELAESAFYAPVLNGALAPGAMAFDLAGNLVPPEAAMSAMAGVFQTGAERVGDAIGALGAMGNDAPAEEAFALTAQWIDFVLIAPGGEETRHRRTVFDRRPPEARAAGSGELLDESALLEDLISTYVVMATGGALSSSYVASRLYEEARFHLDVMDSLSALRSAGGPIDESVALLESLTDYVPRDHLTLFAASDAVDGVLRGVAYRAEPSVIALVGTMTPTAAPRVSSGVDIIANAKRTLHLVDDEVHYDVQGGVLAGAWDTVVEREFAAAKLAVGDTARRGADPLDNALSATRPTDWTVLRPGETADPTAVGVPVEALTAVRADLSNGYAVLVPAAAAPSTPVGWSYWRLDFATGETLGMNAAGRGASMTEFVIGLKVGLVVNTALAIPGIAQCMGSGASWQCYCDVIAFGAFMTLAGAVFSALVAAQWALGVYAFVDIGVVGPVTTAIWSPPVCSGWAGLAGQQRAGRSTGAACWAA